MMTCVRRWLMATVLACCLGGCLLAAARDRTLLPPVVKRDVKPSQDTTTSPRVLSVQLAPALFDRQTTRWETEPGSSVTISTRVANVERVEFYLSNADKAQTAATRRIGDAQRPTQAQREWVAQIRQRAGSPERSRLKVVAFTADGQSTTDIVALWSPAPLTDRPDGGARIAYLSGGNVWVMQADGSGKRRLTRDGALPSGPESMARNAPKPRYVSVDWLDRDQLICLQALGSVEAGRTTVLLLNLTRHNRLSLVKLGGAIAIGVARSSRRIAYVKLTRQRQASDGAQVRDAYLGVADEKGQVAQSKRFEVLDNEWFLRQGPRLSWSPGERYLCLELYARDPSVSPVWIIDRYLGGSRQPAGRGGPFSVSDVIKWRPGDLPVIYCWAWPADQLCWYFGGPSWASPAAGSGLYAYCLKVRELRRLSFQSVTDCDIAPDATQVAFTVQDGATSASAIWVVNADGTNARKLADDANQPTWEP